MPEHFAEGGAIQEIEGGIASSLSSKKVIAIILRRGPLVVAAAAEACRNGEATPEQQKAIIEILDARYGL